MAMHDLIIRGATVVDGLGGDPILGHWVRERGAFDIAEGVRRLAKVTHP